MLQELVDRFSRVCTELHTASGDAFVSIKHRRPTIPPSACREARQGIAPLLFQPEISSGGG